MWGRSSPFSSFIWYSPAAVEDGLCPGFIVKPTPSEVLQSSSLFPFVGPGEGFGWVMLNFSRTVLILFWECFRSSEKERTGGREREEEGERKRERGRECNATLEWVLPTLNSWSGGSRLRYAGKVPPPHTHTGTHMLHWNRPFLL